MGGGGGIARQKTREEKRGQRPDTGETRVVAEEEKGRPRENERKKQGYK